MEFDTLDLAEEMKHAYGNHYVAGQKPEVLKNLISRYEDADEETLEERLTEFMRTKGPYLQALNLPRQSKTRWETFADDQGIHEDIIRTYRAAGIERLYEFQESTVEEILEDNHTLVTAGTGRGKTESWLAPIFQFICEAKEGRHPEHPPQSVKCILTYPTKALAQDQLKRLIEYLYELNKHRTDADKVTVGIFDGDTPPNDPDAYDYLNTAYKFFECPCEHCSSSLTVERTEDEEYLVTHDAATEADVELDFIKLTRDEIVDAEVDILLTNPDTINYRLFNINENEEQSVFVTQPKYFVFDEIHEYSELFGSFTSTLMRRYVREREELLDIEPEEDTLKLIGASATVENRRSIFQRINPFIDADISVVKESPRTIDESMPATVPEQYRDESLNIEKLEAIVGSDNAHPIAESLRRYAGVEGEDEDRTESGELRAIGNKLYTRLVEKEDDELSFVRALYGQLNETPERPSELEDIVASELGFTSTEAEALVQNFITIGQLSGVLESRAHLFSWPLDGYYTCVNCAAVYDTPQSACTECGHHFVTKLTYCTHCGEESLESRFCPDCERLSPLTVTSGEGRFEYFSTHQCNCGTETIRTVWRPYYECSSCGTRQKIDRVESCEDCGSVLVLANDQSGYRCTNPDCGATSEKTEFVTCQNCHSKELEPLADDDVLYCESCGDLNEEPTGQVCECGGELTPKRYLGWACSDQACDAVYFGHPPNTCDCGNRRFVRTGLFDINQIDYCETCDTELLPGATCDCDEPAIDSTVRGFTQYKMVDENGQIRSPTDFPGAVPCYDYRKSYRKSDRFESMLRGPGNTAAYTSQYLLRSIADTSDPDSFTRAKMLSFADSQKDMKELARDFNDPERQLFFSQVLVEALETSDGSWSSLADIQSKAVTIAEEYERLLLDREDASHNPILSKLTGYQQSVEEYVHEEIAARVLSGRFNDRRREFLRLPLNGIVNVRLDVEADTLEPTKREIIGALLNQSKRYVETLAEDIEGASAHVEELVDEGVLRRIDTESGYLVGLNENRVECAVVSEAVPISYLPTEEQFVTKLEATYGSTDVDAAVDFTISYTERGEFTHPHLDLTAFRLSTSDPMMLLARAYFGLTEKEERRQLEYQFREGRYPHFLSSGPAMELGVDIGDLDALLLYGSPPNTNSYLQRVGRAGRESGSSLIHSISQRNPIDYYYYERPSELIRAEPQPVPLNEANEEVLRISLTWAILDYIAATEWVPWREERSSMGDAVYFDDEPVPRTEPKPNDVLTFSHLLSRPNEEVQYGGDDAPLQAIASIVESEREDVREWLLDLIRFSYCRQCGRKHAAGYKGDCRRNECDGTVVSAPEEHGHVVDTVLSTFDEELIDLYDNFELDILDELEELQSEINQLQLDIKQAKRKGRRGDDEELLQDEERLDRLNNRSSQLNQYLGELESMDFGTFLENQSNAPFSLRSVSDSVNYELIGDEFEPATNGVLSRRIQVALSELHPGAAYLHSDNDIYIVTEVTPDSFETASIQEDVPDTTICPVCATEYEMGAGTCESCGHPLKRLTTIVPERITAHKADLQLGQLPNGDILTPTRIYQSQDVEIQSTYAPVESEVTSFEPDPDKTFAIVTQDGEEVGRFAHGEVTVRSSVSHFQATYKGGGSDPLPNVFEVCGVDGCDGIVARDDETAYCVRHPEHSTDDTRAVRLATEFQTKSVRVQFEDEAVEHTFGHGLRVALQYIGGVGVRKVPESIEDDGTYVFDGDEGGSGITVLLTLATGDEYRKFDKALEIMEDAFECDCDDGCPFCIYQYACTNQNDPHSFDRESLFQLLDSNLALKPVEPIEEDDE